MYVCNNCVQISTFALLPPIRVQFVVINRIRRTPRTHSVNINNEEQFIKENFAQVIVRFDRKDGLRNEARNNM